MTSSSSRPAVACRGVNANVMEERREADVQGALVAWRGGTPVIESYSGLADQQSGEPCDSSTRFQLASVSKQFTAAAALLLVERGVLALADPIGRWLGPTPPSWKEITVHHLLTHTSGLGHWPEYPDVNLYGRTDAEQEITAFQSRPLLFSPGSGWRYSSPGYVLLAGIIERASGEAYATFLTDRILRPANLDETFVGNPHGRPRVARGYRDGKAVDSFDLDVVGIGAGDVSATGADLAHWIRALGSGRVLTEASRQTMLTSHAVVGDARTSSLVSDIHYGYGVFIGRAQAVPVIYHTGDNFGFKAMSVWLPESDVAVAILSNEESTDLEGLISGILPSLLTTS
jgi:CubicO group peptidase (beta-lactamase class C family)